MPLTLSFPKMDDSESFCSMSMFPTSTDTKAPEVPKYSLIYENTGLT